MRQRKHITQMLDKSSPFIYNEGRMEEQERIQRHRLTQKEQGTHVYSQQSLPRTS